MPDQASQSFITLLSIIASLSPIPSCFLDLSTVPQPCPEFSDSKAEKYKKYKRPVQVGGAIKPSDAHIMIPHSLREKYFVEKNLEPRRGKSISEGTLWDNVGKVPFALCASVSSFVKLEIRSDGP